MTESYKAMHGLNIYNPFSSYVNACRTTSRAAVVVCYSSVSRGRRLHSHPIQNHQERTRKTEHGPPHISSHSLTQSDQTTVVTQKHRRTHSVSTILLELASSTGYLTPRSQATMRGVSQTVTSKIICTNILNISLTHWQMSVKFCRVLSCGCVGSIRLQLDVPQGVTV